MTIYTILDTETTGIPARKLPADHSDQPRLAHIAMINLDTNLQEVSTLDRYIQPDGWEMDEEDPRGAFAVNGLSNTFLHDNGVPIFDVLEQYTSVIEEGRIICAYAADFDLKILRGELRRAGMPDLFEATPNICLMRAYKAWRNVFKGYKLVDACAYLKIPHGGPHQGMPDCRAALGVFRALMAANALPEPEVHYSKNYEAIRARGLGIEQPNIDPADDGMDRNIYPPDATFRVIT